MHSRLPVATTYTCSHYSTVFHGILIYRTTDAFRWVFITFLRSVTVSVLISCGLNFRFTCHQFGGCTCRRRLLFAVTFLFRLWCYSPTVSTLLEFSHSVIPSVPPAIRYVVLPVLRWISHSSAFYPVTVTTWIYVRSLHSGCLPLFCHVATAIPADFAFTVHRYHSGYQSATLRLVCLPPPAPATWIFWMPGSCHTPATAGPAGLQYFHPTWIHTLTRFTPKSATVLLGPLLFLFYLPGVLHSAPAPFDFSAWFHSSHLHRLAHLYLQNFWF